MTTLPSSKRLLDPERLPGWREYVGMAAITMLLFLGQWFLVQRIPTGGAIDLGYLMLTIPLAVGVCYLVWLREKVWIVTALLAHISFMLSVKKGVGVNEAIFGIVTLFGLIIWFVKEVAIARRRIVESGFDLLLLSFVGISTVTTLIANRIFGGNMNFYVNEWLPTYDLLLYFPLKKMLQTRNDVKVVVGAFAVIGLAAGLYGVLTYRERLLQSAFQFQIESSRVFANETTAMLFVIMFATLFAYSRGLFGKLGSFAGMGLGALFLGVSFARGAIVTGIGGLLMLAVILPFRRGSRVIIALGGSIIALIGILFLFAPALVGNFARAMEMRLATVGSAGKDLSFTTRLVEAKVVLEHVARNPLLGYGYGVLFKFTDPITVRTAYIGYIHNGYVRPLYKFGIPLAILVYLILLYPLIRLSVRHPDRHGEPFLWGLSAGSASYLASVVVLNYTTEVFSVFWSAVNFAVVWAVLDYVNRELKGREAVLAPASFGPAPSGPPHSGDSGTSDMLASPGAA